MYIRNSKNINNYFLKWNYLKFLEFSQSYHNKDHLYGKKIHTFCTFI